MGKHVRYEQQHNSKSTRSLMVMNKKYVKKSAVKITYISSPLLVRACDASEFRSVVQQLTGKDSNRLVHQNQDPPTNWIMQSSGVGDLTRAAQEQSCYNCNRSSTNSLDFDEDYLWKLQDQVYLQHEYNQALITAPPAEVLFGVHRGTLVFS
ncbi:hypothetical protein SESBI_41898 [Sesbania bispinosa]|nr:hypothetical protein SESBI_41898 [Sesbania bispinosa]